MSPPVYNCGGPSGPTGSPPPARADRPESNTAKPVNVEQHVTLTELYPAYRDRVKHTPDSEPTWSEAERVAFLRRAQQEGRQ